MKKEACRHLWRLYCINCGTWWNKVSCAFHQAPFKKCVITDCNVVDEP